MTFLKMKLIGYIAGRNRPYKRAHDDLDHVNRFIDLEATVDVNDKGDEGDEEDSDGASPGIPD